MSVVNPSKDNSKSQPVKTVAVAYHYFAHYRKPILQKLRSSSKYHYVLLSDDRANIPSIKTLSAAYYKDTWTREDGSCDWLRLRNFWIGPLLWQRGICSQALSKKYAAIIFLGDAFFVSTWVAAILARLSGKQIFFWTHGIYGRESFLKKLYRTRFYSLANAGLLLYGNHALELLSDAGFDREKLYNIYNSLDHDRQLQLRATLTPDLESTTRRQLFPQSPQLPLAMFVGRLTPEKKLASLIEATIELIQAGKPINLVIVGGGEFAEPLAALIPEDYRQHFNLLGPCHDEQKLAAIIYSSNVCVSPGNIGLTAVHSLVYGTPVVTHNDACWQGPEFEAVTPEVSGTLFQKDDLLSLIAAMEDWLFLNDEQRTVTRHVCHEVIDSHFTPNHQIRIIEHALDRALAGKV